MERTGIDSTVKTLKSHRPSAYSIMAAKIDAALLDDGLSGAVENHEGTVKPAAVDSSDGTPPPKKQSKKLTTSPDTKRPVILDKNLSIKQSTLQPGPVQLLMAYKYDASRLNPTGYWVSEKLDGVRAYWDGHGTLWTRIGRPFAAPKAFLEQLPRGHALDGELFIDRGRFDETSGIVRTTVPGAVNDARWEQIHYMVFDVPSLGHLPFEQRQYELQQIVTGIKSGTLKVVDQIQCKDVEHLTELVARVAEQGGEGVMLRQPGSLYANKRDRSLLKVKSFYDAEARVVGYEPGKGKYKGMVGSLICQMESGQSFSVGSGLSDQRRSDPPKVGSIVTYRFQELTKSGVPRFPVFVGERIDAETPKDAIV
ncbi:hypothetical protein OIV83_005010 [Microbotryomycetes sp. JL201]|nr:hypothetical protein OIV83_005010 [Microbotryomycetes sp. JL201]